MQLPRVLGQVLIAVFGYDEESSIRTSPTPYAYKLGSTVRT